MTIVRSRSRRSRSRGIDPVGTRGLIRPAESGLTDVFATRLPGRRVQAIGRQSKRAERQLAQRGALPLNDDHMAVKRAAGIA